MSDIHIEIAERDNIGVEIVEAQPIHIDIQAGMPGPAGPQGPKGDKGDKGDQGDPGINTWGSITGTLSDQTDLQNALNTKIEAGANISIFTNDAGYITGINWNGIGGTQSDVNVGGFTNDVGYLTSSDLSGYVPYIGATTALNLGANNLIVDTNTLFVDTSTKRIGVGTTTPTSKLEVRATVEQFRLSYDGSNRFTTLVSSTGNATFDLVGSNPQFVWNKFQRGDAGQFIRNSFYSIGGQGTNDMSITGLFDRSQTTNADLTGSITVNITGAGVHTPAQDQFLVNGSADFGSTWITGMDNTTSMVEIIIDTGVQQENYASAVRQPFLMTRGVSGATFAKNIDVHISSNGTDWFQGAGWNTTDFANDAQLKATNNITPVMWLGGNSIVTGLTGSRWRYARFRLTDFDITDAYAFKDRLWISQVGIRHYSHTIAPQLLPYRNPDRIYGTLTIQENGLTKNLNFPAISSARPILQGITNSGVSIVSAGVNDGSRNRRVGIYIDDTNNESGIAYTRGGGGAYTFVIKEVNTNRLLIDTVGSFVINPAGTSANASAVFQIDSTTKGFLPPRMTTAQRDAISSPAEGLVIYNTTDKKHQGYDGTTWNDFY